MSRFDYPDAGAGLDSNQYDDRPIDAADLLQDDPDLDPREPRRLGDTLDPMIVAERDVVMGLAALDQQVQREGGSVSRAFELYRIASRIDRLATSLLNDAADRHLALASQS